MSGEPTVPVLCCGNNNKQYDGKTWIEKVKQIVEVNGETVDFSQVSDDDIPKLRHGDAVVIKYPRKGSKSFSLFRGIVNLEPMYPQSGPPSTSSELEEPKSAGSSASPGLRELAPRRKRKLKDVHAPSGNATTSGPVSDPVSPELMPPPLQPPRRLALSRTPRCTPAITAGTALDSACQQVVPPLEPPRKYIPPSLRPRDAARDT